MNIFKIKTAGTDERILFEHNSIVFLVMNCKNTKDYLHEQQNFNKL